MAPPCNVTRISNSVVARYEPISVGLQVKSRIVEAMIKPLQYIKSNSTKDSRILDSCVIEFFHAVVDAGKLDLFKKFTEEETRKIGSLIKQTIPDIDSCLYTLGDVFDADKGPEALMARSGFQFMVENFKNFPDGSGGTLASSFEYFSELHTIEILDDALATWKAMPYICDDDLQHSFNVLNRPKDVSESHHWWF